MSDIIRKLGLFGIGILAITQEKLEELTSDMVSKGEMNREEGKKFVKDVLAEKDRQVKELRETINALVKDSVDKAGFASKKDIAEIKDRLYSLEQKFN